jgi:hypothetical protein
MQKTFIGLVFIAAAALALNAFAANPPSNNPSKPSSTTQADPAKKSPMTSTTPSTTSPSTTSPSTTSPTMSTTSNGMGHGSFKIDMISAWPAESKQAAEAIMAKYGMPTEHTSSMLVWEKTGPWKKTVVTKDAIDHQFPVAHKDVLKQVVDYKVPADKADELAQFDGSVIIDRTKGEVAVRCDKEENNFIAMNLVDEIVKGKKTVKQARDTMAKAVTGTQLAGNEGMFKDGLKFQVATSSTADADKSLPMGR